MSDVAVTLVTEGPTDAIVIEAALQAILPQQQFISTRVQPSVPLGETGGGWGGVYRWLQKTTKDSPGPLSQNPLLRHRDMIIIQVDADVAGFKYADANIVCQQNNLPCNQKCPPASNTVDSLKLVINGWVATGTFCNKTVLCIPSQCIEAWVAAAVFGSIDKNLLSDIECNKNIANYLSSKPIKDRIRKRPSDFRKIQNTLTQRWPFVEQHCPQAHAFSEAVKAAPLPA